MYNIFGIYFVEWRKTMYQLIGSLKGHIYDELINLLIKKSDSFLFHLPNMGKTIVNKRNAELMPEYPIGYSYEEDQDLHIAYIEKMNIYLNLIKSDIIKHYIDTGYLDQVSSNEIEVFYAAISERTKIFFSLTNNFSKWMYPMLPEDPCFICNEKCIFQCISHENLFFLYLDDIDIKCFLKKNKIKFEFIPDIKPPAFS